MNSSWVYNEPPSWQQTLSRDTSLDNFPMLDNSSNTPNKHYPKDGIITTNSTTIAINNSSGVCSGGGVSGTVTVHQHPSLPRKSKLQEQFHTVFESFLIISVLIIESVWLWKFVFSWKQDFLQIIKKVPSFQVNCLCRKSSESFRFFLSITCKL